VVGGPGEGAGGLRQRSAGEGDVVVLVERAGAGNVDLAGGVDGGGGGGIGVESSAGDVEGGGAFGGRTNVHRATATHVDGAAGHCHSSTGWC
jgi:hypothetical protein